MLRPPRSAVAVLAGIALALAGVAGAGAIGLRPSLSGESHPTSIDHLRPAGVTSPTGFVPVAPCRIVDTRASTAGKLTTTASRGFQVTGSTGFTAQGGAATGCGIPKEASAVAVSITATNPDGNGFLRAWPHTTPPPTATVLNWQAVGNSGVTTGATLVPGNGVVDVRAFGNATDLVIDVSGYYVEPVSVQVGFMGNLVGWSSGIVYSDRTTTGNYVIQTTRPMTGCHVTATPLDVGAKAFAYANGSYIYVIVSDVDTGAEENHNFTASATC